MRFFHKLLLIVWCLISSSVYATQQQSFSLGIAVVDVQSILENSLAVQTIRNSINSISQKIQDDIEKKETELKKIEEQLLNKRGALSEEAFEKEIREFNKKVSAAQKEVQKKKTALEQAHSEAISKVHAATIEIITNLAKKYNLKMVLPSSQILFTVSELNITAEVIKQLNDKLKSVKVNYNL